MTEILTIVQDILDELLTNLLINEKNQEKKENLIIIDNDNVDIDDLIEKTNNLSIVEKINTSPNKKLASIIASNKYVQNCSVNNKKDFHSLSFLIDQDLSQSSCIKIGHGVEKIFDSFILSSNTSLKSIKPKNSKGEKEKDHLYEDENNKIIYYAELKSNLNLDTEKSKTTSKKCLDIELELKQQYPEHTIKMFLVGIRYFSKIIMPSVILKKYSNISDKLVGVNDYFHNLGINELFIDENDYKIFLNELSTNMF